jgi:predicted nucleotidyltransferase
MVIIPQHDCDIVKGKGIDPVILRSILRRVLSVTRPQKIILFGSAARGDAGPDSDIDLLVIGNVAHRGRTAQRIYRRLIGVGAPVDIVVATPGDIERYKDSAGTIFRKALREGKVVYAA